MVQNTRESIKNDLRTKQQIYVPDEWLDEVSTEQQENPNINLNYDYYYRRWLETNLLDLNYTSVSVPNILPDHSIPSRIYNMNSTFQIIRVQDIGLPTPNDYCENLYNKANEDEEHENEAEQPPNNQRNNAQRFARSKQRQLAFKLFNGKKMLKAFEFEPINQLTFQNCYPGAKLLIKGEVEHSINVLLLRAHNVIALGGTRLEIYEEETSQMNNQNVNQINNQNVNQINNQNVNQVNSRNANQMNNRNVNHQNN